MGLNKGISILRITLSIFLILLGIHLVSDSVLAATSIIRPNGDSVIQWTSTGTNHYDQIDEEVTQPTAGTTTDNVNNGGSSGNVNRFTMQTIPNITSVSAVTVWVYGTATRNNSAMSVDLYYNGGVQNLGDVTFGTANNYSWQSVTFSGLNLSQSQLDGLEVIITGNAGGRTYTVATLYASVTYTIFTVDLVDSVGNSVATPSITMSALTFDFNPQTSTGTFGVSSQKPRVVNGTTNPSWNLSLSATNGQTSLWTGNGNFYDYNDPTAQAEDGTDTDSFGGQMTVDPSAGTITAQSGCSTTGLTRGSSNAFNEENSTSSITLLSAGATANVDCYWDFTGVSISQTVPAEQPVDNYSLQMTLTLVAI